jgi:hypothetical protein
MVRSGTPEPSGGDQSLGDLVSLATKDITQLVRYEIDLAKTELRGDLKRVGLAGALGGVAAFTGCLVLVLLCIALAYGLTALGIWTWAAFLIVAGACVLLAGSAVGIAFLKVRRISGMKKTRESVTEGLGMLRRDSKDHDGTGDAKSIQGADGHRPRRARLRVGTSGTGGTGAGGQSPAGEISTDGLPADVPDRTAR